MSLPETIPALLMMTVGSPICEWRSQHEGGKFTARPVAMRKGKETDLQIRACDSPHLGFFWLYLAPGNNLTHRKCIL